MHKRMVIFDFDGVICDSWWLTHKTSKKAFPGLTEEEHRQGFEGNIYEAEKAWSHLTKVDIDYFDEYQKEMHLVKFFLEMESVIRRLSKVYTLVIVSSSTNDVIYRYLKRESIDSEFTDVLGADVHASKHEKIQMLFAKYSFAAADCVMITDTTGDIKEARMAGVDCIAVTWGFHSAETLARSAPFRVVQKPGDIEPAIEAYFSPKSDIIS